MPLWEEMPSRLEPGGNPFEAIMNTIRDLNSQGLSHVPVNVQNQVASAVRGEYVRQWQDYHKSGGTLNFKEYYTHGREGNGFQSALSRPLDFSIYAAQPVEFHSNNQLVHKSLGELVPELHNIRNVQDANRFITRSFFPAISGENKYRDDALERYNVMATAVADNIWQYTPFYRDGHSGKLKQRSLLTHVSYQIRGEETSWRRANERVISESSFNDDLKSGVSWIDEFVNAPVPNNSYSLQHLQNSARSFYPNYGVSRSLSQYLDYGDVVKIEPKPGSLLNQMGVHEGDMVPGLGAVITGRAFGSSPNGRPGYVEDIADNLEAGVPQSLKVVAPVSYGAENEEIVFGNSERSGAAGFTPIRPVSLPQQPERLEYWVSPEPERYYASKLDFAYGRKIAAYAENLQARLDRATDPMEKAMLSRKLEIAYFQASERGVPLNQAQTGRTSDSYGPAWVNKSPSLNQRTAEEYWGSEDRAALERQRARDNSGDVTLVDAKGYSTGPNKYTAYTGQLQAKYANTNDPVLIDMLQNKMRIAERMTASEQPYPVLETANDPTSRQVHQVMTTGRALPISQLVSGGQSEINDAIYRGTGDPRYHARRGTVLYDEFNLEAQLATVRDPAKRAALRWAGTATKEGLEDWQASVRQLNDRLNTNLSTVPQKFGPAYEKLLIDDPETASQFQGILPTRAELKAKFEAMAARRAGGSPTRASRAQAAARASEPNILSAPSEIGRPTGQGAPPAPRQSQYAVDNPPQLFLPEPPQRLMLPAPSSSTINIQSRSGSGVIYVPPTSASAITAPNNPLPLTSGGSGGVIPPIPPAAPPPDDFSDEERDEANAYDNRDTSYTSWQANLDALNARSAARAEQNRKINPSSYRIDSGNVVNSLANFDAGYARWAAWNKNPFEGPRTRGNYSAQMARSWGMLISVDDGRTRTRMVNGDPHDEGAGSLFGFLQPSHRADILSIAKGQYPTVPTHPVPGSEVEETMRMGGVDTRDPYTDRRISGVNGALGEYARLRAMTNAELQAKVRLEQREIARTHSGEVLFARDAEVTNIKNALVNPNIQVRDNLYGTFTVGRALDPARQGGLPAGINQNNVETALNWAKGGVDSATRGALPGDTLDALTTIDDRVKTYIRQKADQLAKQLMQVGTSRDDAKAIAEVHETIAKAIYSDAKKIARGTSEELDAFSDDAAAAGYHAQPTRTLSGIKQLFKDNPVLAEKAAKAGMTPESIASLPESEAVTFTTRTSDGLPRSDKVYGTDESGRPYSSEIGNYQNRSGLSLWGGRAGKFLYGAYIAKRLWSMAAQPVMQQSEQYGQYISSIGGLAGYGEGNTNFISTEAGYTSRQQLGQEWLGRGANQEFGFFQTLPYYLSNGNEGLSRQLASAKTALGIGAIASLAPTFVPALAPAAGALSAAGWGIGAAIMGTSLALEGANYLGHTVGELPEYENITMSSIAQDAFVTQPAYGRAIKNYNAAVSSTAQQYGISGVEAGALLGKPESMTYDSMNKNWTTFTFSDEERAFLSNYMTPEDQMRSGANITSEQRKKMERIRKLGTAAVEGGAGDNADAGINAMFKTLGEDISDQQVEETVLSAKSAGREFVSFVSEAGNYASSFGFMPGTKDFQDKFFNYAAGGQTEEDRTRKSYNAGRIAGFGSQLQSQMGIGGEYAGLGARIVSGYNLSTQARIQGTYSLMQSAQSGGAELTPYQLSQMAGASTTMGTLNSQMYASSLGSSLAFMGATGAQSVSAATSFAALGLSTQQTQNFASVLSGDLGARSYIGWQSGNVGDIFRDRFNNPIGETNGLMTLRNMQANQATMPAFNAAYGITANLGSPSGQTQAAQQFLGTTNSGLTSAWLQGGDRGMAAYQAGQNYNFQVAAAGVQVQGVRLSQAFYWGSGSYSNPAEGSMWGMQDQQREMSYASTVADFSSQAQRMQVQNEYASAQESNQAARMKTSYQYNKWSQSFNYNQSLQQRQWAQQDWQYQDQMTSLNYGWQMEDMDTAIRYSSGRERRQLVKQKERATTTHNLEGEQVEETRSRQETTWAAEDERYKKTREYTVDLHKLEKEGFELQKKYRQDLKKIEEDDFSRKQAEFQQNFALETKMTDLQRKFQSDQLNLQIQSAGIAAAAAASQRDYEIALTNSNNKQKDYVGEVAKLNSYDNAWRVANALTSLAAQVDATDPSKIYALNSLINTIANLSPSGLLGYLLGGGD